MTVAESGVALPILPTARLLLCPRRCPGWFLLRYESSTLILYKELSSPIFQMWVSQSVCQASVTPVQISTFCNVWRHECPLLNQYHQLPTATALKCPILTQYTASSSRNAQLSQLDLVLYLSRKHLIQAFTNFKQPSFLTFHQTI